MKKLLIPFVFLLSFYAVTANGDTEKNNDQDSSKRISEIKQLYAEVSRTVKEGDFEGYKATYHKDAVVVYTTASKKGSIPIPTALKNWKIDFTDTKAGKTRNNVAFRFSQRVGDETTAFDSGIFHFTSIDKDGTYKADAYVNFEMLMVKRKGSWYILMEYQKSKASESEWLEMQ